MPQTSYALLTTTGRQKEAAALGGGDQVVITHIAIGDGATVPSGGETALYNETARKTISGQGVVSGASNVAYADIFLAAAEGPYTIREAGMIDSDGDLIAIAHFDPAINKPTPDSGQTVEGTIRMEVAFSDLSVVAITVDPSMTVALQRLSTTPWIPVKSVTTTAPPASPTAGDTYVIPAGATGSWSGHAQKITEYTTAGWAIITPKDGHGVGLPDGRIFTRRSGAYVEQVATDTFKGQVELATLAEVKAGTDTSRAVTSAGVFASYARIIDTAVTKSLFGVSPDFSSWDDALEWLGRYRITPAGSVTFELPSGQHDAADLVFSHPDASRVTFTGQDLTGGGMPAPVSYSITGYGSGAQATDSAGHLTTLRGRIPTEIVFAAGDKFTARASFNFKNLLLSGDSHDDDIFVSGGGAIPDLNSVCVVGAGARGFVAAFGSGLTLTDCMASGCIAENIEAGETGRIAGFGGLASLSSGGYGVNVWRTSHFRMASGTTIILGGNANSGMRVRGASSASVATISASTNGGNGVDCSGSYVELGAFTGSNNGGSGIDCGENGYVSAPSATGSGNGTWGFIAHEGGFISRGGSTLTGASGNNSPALSTEGNNGAWVV